MNQTSAVLELWGGIECTINRVGSRFHSQLARSGHLTRMDDLDRIAALGIRTLRFPLLWEQLAPRDPRAIDWTWADARMARLRELKIEPIVGLVHHGSGPAYTSLIDPHFPELLADYARAVAKRYPWVAAYTPINEPLTTARFSALYGHWFPHSAHPFTFCQALLNQVRATAAAMRAIREINPHAQLVQTEDLGETFSTPRLAYQAEFENERRWLPFDLLTGRLERRGSVWDYLLWAGIDADELARFADEPCPPDVIGINHYVTSSRYLDDRLGRYPPAQHGGNGRNPYVDVDAVRARPEGLGDPQRLFEQTWERYGRPIAITEAHLDCTREEQLRWFAGIWDAAQAARATGANILGVTAWALLGSFDWDSLLVHAAGHYEPGVFDLRSPQPRETALGGVLRECAASGHSRHPLLGAAGWWRRRVRFQPGLEPHGSDPRGEVRTAFTPPGIAIGNLERPPCPMLLITGATGTLGRAFARICYLRGLPFRLLTRGEMDIADRHSVRSAIRAFQPWAIINAAGYVRVDDAETDRDRCFRENTSGPEQLAIACAERHIALLTFSSDLVFDGEKGSAYLESDAVAPLGIYGASKAAAERVVLSTFPDALVVRTSAFFGPWDVHNFVTQTVQSLRAGEPVAVAEDAIISPTYVPDLVHAALNLLVDRESGIWHLANAGAVSWAEFAREIARFAGTDESLVHGVSREDLGATAERPANSALASERGQFLSHFHGGLERYFHNTAAELAALVPCELR